MKYFQILRQYAAWLIIAGLVGAFFGSYDHVRALLGGGRVGGGPATNSGHSSRQPTSMNNSGLKLWLPFNGDANDSSGNSHNGTVSNATLTGGKFDQAYNFVPASASYVQVADTADLNPSNITVAAWFNTNSINTFQIIANKGDGATDANSSYELHIDATSHVQFWAQDGTGWVKADDPATVSASIWHLAVGTYDGSNVKLYVDGTLRKTTAGSFTLKNDTNPLRIGQLNSGAFVFNGKIDDFRAYNRAIDLTEVQQLYRASDPINCDQACIGWWKLDETSGQTVTDSSSGGNNGTLGATSSVAGDDPSLTSGGLVFQGSYNFDGVDDFVNIPHTAALDAYPITVEAWYNTGNVSRDVGIVNKLSRGSNNGWHLGDELGFLRAYYFVDSSNKVGSSGLSGPATAADGNLHYAAFTVDSSGGKLYFDGRLVDSQSWVGTPGATTTTVPVTFGKYENHVDFLSGNIDGVRVYNRALPDYEIYEHYLAGKQS